MNVTENIFTPEPKLMGTHMTREDYWEECICCALDEMGVELKGEVVSRLAKAVSGAHENYGMAFGSPSYGRGPSPAEREWESKHKRLQAEFDTFKNNACTAVKQALHQYDDVQITIREHGEVLRHDGRTERIQ